MGIIGYITLYVAKHNFLFTSCQVFLKKEISCSLTNSTRKNTRKTQFVILYKAYWDKGFPKSLTQGSFPLCTESSQLLLNWPLTFLLTSNIKVKKGPEKGKVYEVVKRKLEMKTIGSVSLRLVWIWEWWFFWWYNVAQFINKSSIIHGY